MPDYEAVYDENVDQQVQWADLWSRYGLYYGNRPSYAVEQDEE